MKLLILMTCLVMSLTTFAKVMEDPYNSDCPKRCQVKLEYSKGLCKSYEMCKTFTYNIDSGSCLINSKDRVWGLVEVYSCQAPVPNR